MLVATNYPRRCRKNVSGNFNLSPEQVAEFLQLMASGQLHDKDWVAGAADISRNGKEVEAESVAYVVCQHYGINTSDYSFSYVAGWSEGKETPELKSSLDKIRQTAAEFITKLDEKLEVLMQSKELVAEDITNLKGINYEYHSGDRTSEVTFECEVKGEKDILTYKVFKHDDGDAFTIDTEKTNIKKNMSVGELVKLEGTLYTATEIFKWDRKIDAVKTPDDAKDLEFEFMESELKGISVEQAQKIHSKIDEKMQTLTEKVPNPELKELVDKMVGDLDKKRSSAKSKTSVKSKIKEEKEKSDKTPKKPRATTKSKKEERA